MNIKNTIIKHYKNFFDLHAKGIALDEDDHLNIDWADDLVKNCFIADVSQRSELLAFLMWYDEKMYHNSNKETALQLIDEYKANCG
jgi:hypothetical protein